MLAYTTYRQDANTTSKRKQTRHNHYALDNEENEPGVRCIAVPVWNHESRVIAALSLSTLTSRVNDDQLSACRQKLIEAGLGLSKTLGYRER